MGRPPRLLAAISAAGLLLAACTGGSASTPGPPTDAYQVPSIAQVVPEGASAIPGTLLIRRSDGSLLTLRPDGSG